MSNTPVVTAYTHAFIRSALPAEARSLLEIGCGDGELAKRLLGDGFEVTAVDTDPACVAAAKGRGVDARLIEWPAELVRQFDAILFTRSLHHVHDLAGAVSAAARALKPGGRVIVEDFRAEGGSRRASDWYEAVVHELLAGGALADGVDAEGLLGKLPLALHDGHELHSSTAIQVALEREFAVAASDAAYYFRYLEPHLREVGAAQWLLDIELEQIEASDIDALGKRFVASLR